MAQTNIQNQVPFSQKLFYGLGGGGESSMGGIIFVLALRIFFWEYGLSAGLVGLALSIPRLWDAVTDPVMGSISDNAKTRWGRRRPFIFIGSILTGLICMVLWSPPANLGTTGLFVYLLILSILFFTSYTVFCIPYVAMGFEMTSNYNERTSVMAFKVFFCNFINLVLMSIAYKLCLFKGFGETPDQAVRVVGVIYGALIIILGVIPAIFCHTQPIPEVVTKKRIGMFKAIFLTFGNRPYMALTISTLLMVMGIYVVSQLSACLGLSYVFQGDKEKLATLEVVLSVCYGASGVLGSLAAPAISRRFGKRQTVLATIVLMIAAFAGSWFYITPKYPLLQIFYALLVSPSMTIFLVVTSSMIIDTVDYDEQKTGTRREGIFASVSTFFIKASLALALGLSGLLVNVSGFNPDIAIQSEKTNLALRLMFAFLPLSFLVIVFVLIYTYPLSQEKVSEIQQLLKQRREVVSACDCFRG